MRECELLTTILVQVYNASILLIQHNQRAGWTDFHPVLSVGVPGSCAADVCEPRQDREGATVNGPPWVT